MREDREDPVGIGAFFSTSAETGLPFSVIFQRLLVIVAWGWMEEADAPVVFDVKGEGETSEARLESV
jgi:hypothetical protein